MTYKPTGNPPGRPRKNPLPEPEAPAAVAFPHAPRNRPWDVRDMSLAGKVCSECFPELVGSSKWHSVGCEHGIWFNA